MKIIIFKWRECSGIENRYFIAGRKRREPPNARRPLIFSIWQVLRAYAVLMISNERLGTKDWNKFSAVDIAREEPLIFWRLQSPMLISEALRETFECRLLHRLAIWHRSIFRKESGLRFGLNYANTLPSPDIPRDSSRPLCCHANWKGEKVVFPVAVSLKIYLVFATVILKINCNSAN